MDPYRRANLELWEEWADLHFRGAYDVAGFRAGGDRLSEYEVRELGDVEGKTLLHLQCHFGMDTLAWARRGAIVTGADFSPKAIRYARVLAQEVGLAHRSAFVEAELYDLPNRLEGRFEVVYTSRGVLAWLPDMAGWAQVVNHFLAPGGTFYMTEFHPFAATLEDVDADGFQVRYPYFDRAEPLRWDVTGSYADRAAKLTSKDEYGWVHSLGSIVTALCEVGLRIDFLHEYPFSRYRQFPFLESRADGNWWPRPGLAGEVPLLFSIRAGKPV